MIGRLSVAFAALSLCASSMATTRVPPIYVKNPSIRQVVCDQGLGTAFSIGPGKFITAAHVASASGCEIDGHPITRFYFSGKLDFAVVTSAAQAPAMKLDCSGYRDRDHYFAVGFAGGFPKQRLIVLQSSHAATAILSPFSRFGHILTGSPTIIPGMSGGPITNRAGEVVGIVNAYNSFMVLSISRELRDTFLCGAAV